MRQQEARYSNVGQSYGTNVRISLNRYSMVSLCYLWLFSNSFVGISTLPSEIPIGGIFEDDPRGRAMETAFRFAVDQINQDGKILPGTLLSYHIHYVPRDNSFLASKRVCNLIQNGVAAVFGPQDPMLSAHVHSVCATLEIPHISSRLELEPPFRQSTVNLYPSYSVLNEAFADIVDHWKWTSLVILYEDQFGLVKLQNLLKVQTDTHDQVFIQQVHNQNYRGALLSIKELNIFNVVVDIADENIKHVLRAILQLQMNDFRYHYIFTSFNMELFDLEDFRHNYVNMTAFRLITRDQTAFKDIAQAMAQFRERILLGPSFQTVFNETFQLTTDVALMYDAVHVFAHSIATLDISIAKINCEDTKDNPWEDGVMIQNYLNAANTEGLTGNIRFNQGQRDEFQLDILRLTMNKPGNSERILQIGTWNPSNKTKMTESWKNANDGSQTAVKNSTTLVVMTKLDDPYVMKRNDTDTRGGHDRLFGFCIDLIEKLSIKAGFNYTIVIVPDQEYGLPSPPDANGNRNWSGIVGQLIDKKADLGVAALTITYEREKVIDFTKPFMNLGLSILFKIPRATPSLFSFMKPLSMNIWGYVLCAYAVVSLELFVIARFSPYEWCNPHPCNVHHDILVNQFTLSNTLWFCIGTLMQQGSDVYPRAFSTRIVGGIWWFFTLIIISSYTANLAAFLTVERMDAPIDGAKDLAEQKGGIQFGVLSGGSSNQFFRDARIETYQKMYAWMVKNPHIAFVQDQKEGIERVIKGNYAFLMESTMIEYTAANNCDLKQIGGLLDSKGYGIGTPKGSPWRDTLSLHILELSEAGIIQELKETHWKVKADCKKDRKKDSNNNAALHVDNFGGAFLVLSIGLVGGVIISILEFIWNSRKNAHVDRQSLCSEMAEEFRFAVRCRGSRQKPTLRRQCSQCMPTHSTHVPGGLEFASSGQQDRNGNVGAIDYKRNLYLYGDHRDGL